MTGGAPPGHGGFRRIDEVLSARAAARPNSVALIEAGHRLTYGDFEHAVAGTASWLGELGVGPGDRVMIVCENTLAAPVLVLAAARRDAWAAPVNARLTAREIDEIRAHCGARRIFYTTAASPDAAAHAKRHGAGFVTRPVIGGIAVSATATGAATAAPEPTCDDPAKQVAVLMYTSGTTGTPKGVMLTHANLLFMGRLWAEMRRATEADRLYCVLPVSHIFGLANGVLGAVFAGASTELEARFDAARLYRALGAGTTLLQGVPAMYAKLLEYMEGEGLALDAPALRYVSSGGAPLDLALKRRAEAALGLPFLNGYGLTEASPTVSVMRIDDPLDDTSCGPATPETELRVIDAGSGEPVPRGEIGELLVRGPQVMKGYYRDPDATAAVLSPDGWLTTGDLARIDERGSLWIVGRTRDLVLRSGFNVYPPEVEGVIAAHPEVTLCGVVGRPVPGNEEVIAFVQLAPEATATPAALMAWAAERLAPYKRPARIVILDSLPATASGKVRKHELREIARDL